LGKKRGLIRGVGLPKWCIESLRKILQRARINQWHWKEVEEKSDRERIGESARMGTKTAKNRFEYYCLRAEKKQTMVVKKGRVSKAKKIMQKRNQNLRYAKCGGGDSLARKKKKVGKGRVELEAGGV